MHTTPISTRARQAGMSLVELMVAMVIALIGTIIMFQVFEVSEGIKRSTTAGGDAQQNGVVALHVMETDLRNAGMGFSDTLNFNACTVSAYDAPTPAVAGTPRNYTFRLAPVQITSGGNAQTPDQVAILYGSQHVVGAATMLQTNHTVTTTPLRVLNAYGFRVGDLIVLMEPGAAGAAKNCSLMEVTGLPGGNVITHATGPYELDWLSGTQNRTARANPGGGTGILYGGAGSANATRVFNLGNLYDRSGNYAYNGSSMPVHNTYSISNKALMVGSVFTTAAPNAVVDNIVHMRALYGLDDGTSDQTVPYQTGTVAAGDGKIDRWVDAPKFAGLGNPYSRVVAVRVVVVARSAQPERASDGLASSACDTTSASPTWSAQSWPAVVPPLTQIALDISGLPDWRCYRYKTFETTVPLRNWLWKSS